MSSMGELTFFLGLQVKQKENGIFISQDKYVAEILKKFDFLSVKTASTPIETQKPLVKDEEATNVDVHLYRFQVTPKTSHLQDVKRIFSNEALDIPEKMATGKEISNPFMDGSLPKTTLPTSTMASAIICLATNQKFSFSRYILISLVKNIEAGVPFFMFPRFVQLLIDYQLGDMSHHKDIYINPTLTKKIFSNIKRVGAGFSEVVTTLFDNMLVPTAQEVGLIQANVQSITIPTEPSTSKPHKKHKSKKQQPQEPKVPSLEPSLKHRLPSPSNDLLSGGHDSMKLKELMDLCTHLSNKVLELESKVTGLILKKGLRSGYGYQKKD
uniref:Uncharacterized mitochondrial protein AtMg00810-like n=1 Tax=Tanacetum cinerariifolium TaxID=118510 RepID=A0A6L2L7Y6_TANCI|nr:uncharacterized mitochondrial protein AtMg00810-like [Tanacetum cinerariifolium]